MRFFDDFDMEEFQTSLWLTNGVDDHAELMRKVKQAIGHMNVVYPMVDKLISVLGDYVKHGDHVIRVLLFREYANM